TLEHCKERPNQETGERRQIYQRTPVKYKHKPFVMLKSLTELLSIVESVAKLYNPRTSQEANQTRNGRGVKFTAKVMAVALINTERTDPQPLDAYSSPATCSGRPAGHRGSSLQLDPKTKLQVERLSSQACFDGSLIGGRNTKEFSKPRMDLENDSVERRA
ncbi:unnamed protein product, partial [Musa acuminata subsp. burmannicoides]